MKSICLNQKRHCYLISYQIFNNVFRSLSIILLLIWVNTCIGQKDYYELIKHLDIESGLPSNMVYSVIQDQNGFFWMATDKGVVKYDGENIKVFTTADGLPRNDVFDLKEDSRGRIWLFCYTNALAYIKEDKVIVAQYFESNVITFDFQEDKYGVIFYDKRNNIYLEKNGVIEKQEFDFSLKTLPSEREFFYPVSEKDGELEFIHSQGKTIIFNNDFTEDYLNLVSYFNYDFIFGPENKVFSYNKIYQQLEMLNLSDNSRKSLPLAMNNKSARKIRTYNGRLSIVSGGIMLKVNPKDYEIDTIELDIEKYCSKATSFVETDDLLIVTSLDNGLLVFKKRNNLPIQEKEYYGTTSYYIHENQFIFMGTESGQFQALDKHLNLIYEEKFGPIPQDNLGNSITNIFYDSLNQSLYFNSLNNSLFMSKFSNNPLNFAFKNLRKNYFGTSLLKIYPYKKESFIGVGRREIVLIKFNNEKIEITDTLTNSFSATLYIHDTLYCGKDNLVSILPLKDRLPFELKVDFNVKNIFKFKNELFLGTEGKGLYKMDLKTKNIENLIPNSSITDVVVNNKFIFAPSNKGVYILNNSPPYNIAHFFSDKDGLLSKDIKFADIFNDHFMIITNSGIQLFDTSKIDFNSRIKTYIDHPTLLYKDTIVLDSTRRLKLDIRKIDLIDYPMDYYYTFSTNELDINYIKGGEVDLINLSPGKYFFKYFAENKNYQYHSEIGEKVIIIPPKYYETATFKYGTGITGLFLFGSLITFIIKRQNREKQEKIELEKDYASIELQALQSQMNPHFIFNCLNSIQSLISSGYHKDANRYLLKFSKLLRNFLDQSSNAMNTLDDELESIKNYLDLEKLRFKEKLHYSITCPPDLLNEQILIPSVMIQPFIENAIRHGIFHKEETGNINIDVEKIDNNLNIKIIDDGIGIKASKKINSESRIHHNSRGVSMLYQKAELYKIIEKMEIQINIIDRYETEGKTGTTVNISFPITQPKTSIEI